MSLDLTYRSAFERLWDENSSFSVSNAKPEHAADLLTVFLVRAKERVHFFCRELNPEVYDTDGMLTALREAVSRGVEISVIVQTTPAPGSRFLSALRELAESAKVKPTVLIGAGIQTVEEMKPNFSYVDGRAYRFEPDHKKMVAFACPFKPEAVVVLNQTFERIKAYFTPPHVSHGSPLASLLAQSEGMASIT